VCTSPAHDSLWNLEHWNTFVSDHTWTSCWKCTIRSCLCSKWGFWAAETSEQFLVIMLDLNHQFQLRVQNYTFLNECVMMMLCRRDPEFWQIIAYFLFSKIDDLVRCLAFVQCPINDQNIDFYCAIIRYWSLRTKRIIRAGFCTSQLR